MKQENPLSPHASPGQLSNKSGVRRVNRRPVYLVLGILGLFVLVMMLVAAERAAKQRRPAGVKVAKAGSAIVYAQEIAGRQREGLVPAAPVAPPAVPELTPAAATPALIARPESWDPPPTPPDSASGQGDPRNEELQRVRSAKQRRDEEEQRIRMAKLQQLEEAVKAKTGVAVVAPRSAASPPPGTGNSAPPANREEALARLAAVRQQLDSQSRDYPPPLASGGGLAGAMPPRTAPTAVSAPGGKDYGQFARSGPDDRWRLEAQSEPPRSPYELRAGFVVPATMYSGINSDLPGQVMAQVSQDVFDTATGKWRLIPQGARLVGRYASDVAYGQSRVLIAWQRIVFPDGKALDIGAMPGADGAGYAGFHDQVNNHYPRLFGSAFLLSGVTAGITYSQRQEQGERNQNAPSASSALSEALGQQLGQVTAQLIAKNMNIAPTLEIRPGYRFNVIVVKDLSFTKPYEAFDYINRQEEGRR